MGAGEQATARTRTKYGDSGCARMTTCGFGNDGERVGLRAKIERCVGLAKGCVWRPKPACPSSQFANSDLEGSIMSGHSKWATIKHKKGATDAKRGKVFTRLIKEISIAAKQGGGDPDGNPRLRTAILAAKAENMPADNIKRAIQRGTGELEGVSYDEVVYEGYGPGGVAIMVQVLTDNKNRAVSELRHAFSKNNGNLGESGSVGYLFSKKGLIIVAKSAVSEEKLTEIVLDAGADDLSDEGETWEVITDPRDYDAVLEAIKAAKITPEHSEVTMIASTYQKLEGTQAAAMMRLLETLEDLDDTQNVYTNFDMDEVPVAAAG